MLGLEYGRIGIFQFYEVILLGLMIILMSFVCMLVVQSNPVSAIFSFVLTAFCSYLFLVFLGAEFFALLVLIIYIGVITVLFLFVVILYNLRQIMLPWGQAFSSYYTVALFAFCYKFALVGELCVEGLRPVLKQAILMSDDVVFTIDVLRLAALFNDHYILFLICGLLIFIAMVGSIVITFPFYQYPKV